MQKYFLLIIVLLHTAAIAQTSATGTDSLLKRLNITTSYDDKIELLGKLSDIYSYTDSAKAVYYALQIKKIAEERNDNRGIGIAYYRLGGAYFETTDKEKAEASYKEAEKILENDTSRLGQEILGRAWSSHGLVLQRKGNTDAHLKYLIEKTIPINEKLRDSVNLGKNYYSIGVIFQNIKEYNKAVEYFKKSIAILKNKEWVSELKDNYVRLVESMLYLNVDQKLKDSATGLLKKADKLIKQYPDAISETIYFEIMGTCAEYFDEDLVVADNYYAKAFDLALQNNFKVSQASLLLRRFYIKEKQEKYAEALELVQKIYYDYTDFLTPTDKLLQIKQMMRMQEKLGNIKASLALHQQYIQLSDSIYANNVSVKVQELEQKYEAKAKETQIIKLNQVSQEQQLQIQKNRQWIYLLIGAALLLAGFFIARQIINRNKHKIAVQEAELLQRRIEKMKHEQQINQFAAMLEGQEQERKRLASDLHDGLGGSLSGIRLKLSKIIQDDEMNRESYLNNEGLKKVAGELDQSINELRHIARNMMPESLLKYGLTSAIKDFCRSMESGSVAITFQSYGVSEQLTQQAQIMIFRIIQELITNAVKHANAKHILAECLQQQNVFSITVEDDGSGFDTTAGFEGIGLTTLRNRVKYLEGKVDIHSEKGVGTTTNIEFEIKDEQQN